MAHSFTSAPAILLPAESNGRTDRSAQRWGNLYISISRQAIHSSKTHRFRSLSTVAGHVSTAFGNYGNPVVHPPSGPTGCALSLSGKSIPGPSISANWHYPVLTRIPAAQNPDNIPMKGLQAQLSTTGNGCRKNNNQDCGSFLKINMFHENAAIQFTAYHCTIQYTLQGRRTGYYSSLIHCSGITSNPDMLITSGGIGKRRGGPFLSYPDGKTIPGKGKRSDAGTSRIFKTFTAE